MYETYYRFMNLVTDYKANIILPLSLRDIIIECKVCHDPFLEVCHDPFVLSLIGLLCPFYIFLNSSAIGCIFLIGVES